MRIVILLLVTLANSARAQSYQDKKDNEAIALVTRTLAKLEKVPSLFDGTRIAAGADLQAVDALHHALQLGLRTTETGFADLSPKGAARPEVPPLRAKYDDLVKYRNALGPALARAQIDADASRRKLDQVREVAVKTAAAKCGAFRDEIQNAGIGSELTSLLQLGAGQWVSWNTAEEGARYKGALARLDAMCKRPEYADVGTACELASNVRPADADACTLPPRANELMKRGVSNLIAHHIKIANVAETVRRYEERLGWLDMDGVIGWTGYMTGKQNRDALDKLLSPLMVQANMTKADAEPLFGMLAKDYAALDEKVRATASKWDLPGGACSGDGCDRARGFVAKWYGGASIKRFLHTQPGWKILKNELGVPTYRERYGYALVQVKGEPLCQLRMWTLSEQYAGGGHFAPARDVSLGAVRWQTCK